MSTLITTVAGNHGKAPMAILWAPKGEHTIKCSLNGQPGTCVVRVTSDCVPRLNADLEAKLSSNVKPVGLYDHEMGPASYKPGRFVWNEEKGVVLELEGWTEKGRTDVEGGNYGYHSPRFRRDKGTGEILGLLPESIEVGSLVNDPAFDDIERIAASPSGASTTFLPSPWRPSTSPPWRNSRTAPRWMSICCGQRAF